MNTARAIRRRAEREAQKATRIAQNTAASPPQPEDPKLVISTVPERTSKGYSFNRNVNGRHKRFFNVTDLRTGIEKVFSPFLDAKYPENAIVSFHMIIEKRASDKEELDDFLGKITEDGEEAETELNDTGTDKAGE